MARKFKDSRHTFNYELMKNGIWNEDFLKREDRQMRSVWAINTPPLEEKKYGKHPTQKPLALLLRIVLACTNEGDLVLDPFTGSSTTGLACYLTGRRFIGIDNEEKFLKLSIKRFSDIKHRRGAFGKVKMKLSAKKTQACRERGRGAVTKSIEDFLKELEEVVEQSREG